MKSGLKAFTLGFAANALNPQAVFFFSVDLLDGGSCAYAVPIKFGYGFVMASCSFSGLSGSACS